LKRRDHTSADSARTQEFPLPSDSDRHIYEEDDADDEEPTFRIEVELVEDPEDLDDADDDYSDGGSVSQ
jgi:hypothetical protein